MKIKKYNSIYFVLILLFASCADKQPDQTVNENKIPAKDSLRSVEKEISDRPMEEFIQLVKFIDSSGYSCDTSISIGKEKYSSEKYFFYKMSFESTPLFEHKDPSAYVKGADYCALNIDVFKNCAAIWGFPFLKNGMNEKNTYAPVIGGFIEEFDFPDAGSTANALKEIDRKKSLVFYHTHSFCCSLRNSVFVFNTKAGGFDAALNQFFAQFTKDQRAIVPHNIPCYEDDSK